MHLISRFNFSVCGKKVVYLEIPPLFLFFFIIFCRSYTVVSSTSLKVIKTHKPFKHMTVNVRHPVGLWEDDAM